MEKNIDIAVLELLSSKICHDLISPIGAINNGLELLDGMGAEDSGEVIELISFSAAQASAKLQAYRMAYGISGGDSSLKPEGVHKIIEAIVGAENKISQDWDPYSNLGYSEYPEGFCKILISCLLLAMDCLPKGGQVSVVSCGEGEVLIKARGADASLRAGHERAIKLDMSIDDVEPKHIHPYVTAIMAEKYGFDLVVLPQEDSCVVVSLSRS